MTRSFNACLQTVHNRGKAPVGFLNEMIDWCRSAPDEIFVRNELHDIYSQIVNDLGPWQDLVHRKAAMLEVLRVLGGFESSWNWEAGRDPNNPNPKIEAEEAGIFQCSANSMNFDPSLKRLLIAASGSSEPETFIVTTKRNHQFAVEYCARLLRFTTKHHGPILRKEINSWLSRESVAEFRHYLEI